MLFNNLLDELTRFNQGEHFHAYKILGCKKTQEQNREGFRFTVWAPRAKAVGIVGDFNDWHVTPMEPVYESGFYSIFLDNAYENQAYKYAITTDNDEVVYKLDPFAHRFEMPPKDASIVSDFKDFNWEDDAHMKHRQPFAHLSSPMNIYEVHPSSWKRHYDGRYYSFDDLIEHLIPYVKDMGYTHIELMPVMDHPLEASWGYQITGYFGVSARLGDVDGLKRFVNAAHKAGLGIILDWVPGHFCINYEALAYFDGTPTYESDNPIRALNKRWGAHNFDLGKPQVQSFLISSAFYWISEFHIDGLRVDAVSNMLYLDYDLEPHALNEDGTNTHHDGIGFLRKLNTAVHKHFQGVMMIAEESTSWDGITHPIEQGGLGFDYKWNMGWMNDTLKFFEMDPIYRKYHFKLLYFVFVYMTHENYILPLSHDEVVHGKRSLLDKMPGDRFNQFAQLRLLYAWMMSVTGKKLNFMGHELGQYLEWRFDEELEWQALQYEFNSEYQHYIKTMNHLYKNTEALYDLEQPLEVLWVDDEQTIMFLKRNNLYILMNFIPHEYQSYQIKVKEGALYEVVMNSALREFGGSWDYQKETFETKEDLTIDLVVPAYGTLIIRKRG